MSYTRHCWGGGGAEIPYTDRIIDIIINIYIVYIGIKDEKNTRVQVQQLYK